MWETEHSGNTSGAVGVISVTRAPASELAAVCGPPTDLGNERAAQGHPEGLDRAQSVRYTIFL